MRKLWHALALVGLGLLLAAPVTLDDDNRVTLANCAAGGSGASALPRGTYLLAIFDEETFLCFAAAGSTCAAGGVRLTAGTVLKITTTGDQLSVSCRSAGATGDAEFTPAG